MPKDRMSKREREPLSFHKEAELYRSIPHDSDTPFESVLPNGVIESLQHVKESTKGYVRLLQTRTVFKLPTSLMGHKVRGFDISYKNLEQYYRIRNNPTLVVLGVYSPLEKRRCYEILKFKRDEFANEYMDKLDNYTSNLPQHTSRPQSVAYADPNNYVHNADVEFNTFSMKWYTNFPEDLPNELIESMEDRKLDVEGHAKCYDNCFEVCENADENSKPIYQNRYEDVYQAYAFHQDNRHLIYAVEDKDRQPNHYILIRTKNDYTTGKFKDLYEEATGNKVIIYNLSPSRPISRGPVDPYEFKRVESPPAMPQSVYSVPSRNYSVRSGAGFETTHIVNGHRPSRNNKIDIRKEIMAIPDSDDDDWEADVAYVREDPYNGPQIDNDGSILMFVAHKQSRR